MFTDLLLTFTDPHPHISPNQQMTYYKESLSPSKRLGRNRQNAWDWFNRIERVYYTQDHGMTRLKFMKLAFLMIVCCSMAFTVFILIYCSDYRDRNDYSETNRFFLSKNAIIIGTVKDGSSTLPSILLELDHFSNYFNDTKFIIFESNSEDNTLEILLEWKGSNENKIILNDDRLITDVLGSNISAIRPKGREEVYVEYR